VHIQYSKFNNVQNKNSSKWSDSLGQAHCTENPIYVFPEEEMRGLSPNSYIHVFVSDL
jgi:hypothetical protein